MCDNSGKYPNLDPPNDPFFSWCDDVYELLNEGDFDEIDISGFIDCKLENEFLQFLYNREVSTAAAAKMLPIFFNEVKDKI